MKFLLIRKFLISIIKFYRIGIAPYKLPSCKFYPSCSSYMLESIEQHGCFVGMVRGMCRLLRCHPFSKGGYDPVQNEQILGD